MSYDDLGDRHRKRDGSLRTLLDELADEVSHVPQREYTASAWARARRVRRRHAALVAAAVAMALVAVPVAVLVSGEDDPAPPADPVYSEEPVRGRAAHTATLLADGRVLVAGGCTVDGCTAAEGFPGTEYYVPGQGFTAGPELVVPRQGHTATLLADGRVLIVGGWARERSSPLDLAEVYEPEERRFVPVGRLAVGRGGHSATVLPDGRVLIAGGDNVTAELFDPERDEFTLAEPMPEPRFGAPAIALPGGRVLVVGGRDAAGQALASAVLYNPESDTWQPTGSMGTPRDRHTLAPLPDGRVLAVGGTANDRELLSTTEVFDPRTGRFEPGPPLDTDRYKVAAAVDANGRVIIAGGAQAAVYDSGGFQPIDGTAGSLRWYPTVTSLPGGDVLIVGGYDDTIQVHDDHLLVSASQIAAATR